jgi:hypothetical protein
VPNRIFNLYLVKDSAIVKLDKQSISNGALGRLMVFSTKTLILNTVNLGAQGIDAWVGSRGIGAKLRFIWLRTLAWKCRRTY